MPVIGAFYCLKVNNVLKKRVTEFYHDFLLYLINAGDFNFLASFL